MAEASPATGVRVEDRGAVRWITIDRPQRRNALNDEVARAIAEAVEHATNRSGALREAEHATDRSGALREAERATNRSAAKRAAEPPIRAIVLTGAGDKAFCAGGDLQASQGDSPFEVDPARPFNPIIDLFKTLERCTLPTIARVNGHALAGGMGLMCACDIVIAADSATFGVPETGVGLFPMMILPYMLRAMPRRKLLEWCITGERFGAAEALEAGLLNAVVPASELDARVERLLATIVDRSPTAIRLGKTGFHAIEDMTLAQAFEYAQLMLPNMARTQDAKEGFRAFREKRAPGFEGN